MGKYIDTINKQIEDNIDKYSSLTQYREAIEKNENLIGKEELSTRLKQIDEELKNISELLNEDKEIATHYDMAYSILMELNQLEKDLRNAKSEDESKMVEEKIVKDTTLLEKHLDAIPDEAETELEEEYQNYIDANSEDNNMDENIVKTNDMPSINATEPTVAPEDGDEEINVFNLLYYSLVELYEAERMAFRDRNNIASVENLKAFLEDYMTAKIECYQSIMDYVNSPDSKNIEEQKETTQATQPNTAKEEQTDEENDTIEVQEEENDAPSSVHNSIVMLSLVDGLECTATPGIKLHALNVKSSDEFLKELKEGAVSYNVIHSSGTVIESVGVTNGEFMSDVTSIEKNRKQVEILKSRINELPEKTLVSLYNSYYSGISNRKLPTALRILISERVEG